VRRQLIRACASVLVGLALCGAGTAHALNPAHDCSFCHNLHGASAASLLNDAVVETLCLTCHGPAGTSVLKAEVHTNKPSSSHAAFSMTCMDCHNPHSDLGNWLGGTNLALVGRELDSSFLAKIATPNSGIRDVVFESRGTDGGGPSLHSFADGDENGDGIWDGACEVCHTQTSYHRNSAAGDHLHKLGQDCTVCHPHASSFAPEGGSCQDCHSNPQDNGDSVPVGVRRPVVSEFGLSSHHLQGASLDDADCVVCHDMSQHQQGNVRLKHPDDPTNPAAVVVLTGDPATDPAEADKLTPICLACHDADAAGGSNPFSDGLTPPIVDAAVWAAGSHNTTGVLSCVGDGSGFGCHATHGSEKLGLLAPWDVAPTAPEYVEEEEGFCFACHGSSGPAGSDIEGQFATATRWVTAAVGDFNNQNLNDRHDIAHADQSQSGAKLECVDCHDPHTASAASLVRADPDPSDGRVPGTGQVMAGVDFMTEWCLDCHDGSFPAGVTPPSTSLANIRSTHLTDSMGAAGGNASLKSGYGWADGDTLPCLSCHNPHPGVLASKQNLFQHWDTILSKDGTTPIPSDNVGFAYELTDNSVKNATVNGYELCNTCHTGSMGDKKSNCFACHYHGTRY
jgi:predicted CXXCH cytochrome family protein